MKMKVEHWQCQMCQNWFHFGQLHYCQVTQTHHIGTVATPLRQLTEEDVRRIVRDEMGK